MTENVSLKKYIITFFVTYIALGLIIEVVLILLDKESRSMNLMSVIMSAHIAGGMFVNDNLRLPTASEKRQLILYSFIACIVATIVAVGCMSLVYPDLPAALWEVFTSLRTKVLVITFGLLFVLIPLTLWFGYNLSAKTQYKVLKKQGKV